MKKYIVTIKETYVYDSVEAENGQQALDKVINLEGWNDCDNQWESRVKEVKEI